jgi:hypothetical protein
MSNRGTAREPGGKAHCICMFGAIFDLFLFCSVFLEKSSLMDNIAGYGVWFFNFLA